MSLYIWDKPSQELIPIAGLANINDSSSASDTTYSSEKLDTELGAKIDSADANTNFAKQLVIDAREYANLTTAWPFIYSKVNKKGCYIVNVILSGGMPITMIISTSSGSTGTGLYTNWNGEVHGIRFQGESLTAF